MGRDISRKLVVGLFLTILISPYIFWLTGVDIKLEEKRALARMPEFSIDAIKDHKYFSSIEEYFNDHFSYRGILIKLKNWIDYYVFHTSPSSKVHIGKDGWLYYFRTEHEYFKVDDCIPAEKKKMLNLARELHYLERIVEASGRRFVLLIAPDKTTIYPEYFGVERPDLKCHMNRYDLLMKYMQKYPVKNFIPLDRLLQAVKKKRQVYYKTDTHWNDYGAMVAAWALLRHLTGKNWRNFFPHIEMGEKLYSGDLSKMIAIDIKEKTEFIKKIDYPSVIREINMGRYMNGKRLRYVTADIDMKDSDKLLPRAILFRDSFATKIIKYIAGSFKQLDVIWSNNVTTRLVPEPVEDVLKARIIILEIAEMYLPGFSVDVERWYKVLLAGKKIRKGSSNL